MNVVFFFFYYYFLLREQSNGWLHSAINVLEIPVDGKKAGVCGADAAPERQSSYPGAIAFSIMHLAKTLHFKFPQRCLDLTLYFSLAAFTIRHLIMFLFIYFLLSTHYASSISCTASQSPVVWQIYWLLLNFTFFPFSNFFLWTDSGLSICIQTQVQVE